MEYELPGINQGQINEKAGFTFAKGLRAVLRQDPDVIMVGEIRDTETLTTAIEASLTVPAGVRHLFGEDVPELLARVRESTTTLEEVVRVTQ